LGPELLASMSNGAKGTAMDWLGGEEVCEDSDTDEYSGGRQLPVIREKLSKTAVPERFCEASQDPSVVASVQAGATVPTLLTDGSMLKVFVEFAQAEGGSFSSSDIGKLYTKHPGLHTALCDAGGLKQFCTLHAELAFENGTCKLTGDSTEDSSAAEFVSIASVLPAFEYPPRVALIIAQVKRACRCVPGASVHAFGSAVNGFGDAASDIDLVLEASPSSLKKGLDLGKVSRKDIAPRTLAYMQRTLRKEGFIIVEKVLGAKVPILKLKYGRDDCDLSCNNLLPVFNTRLFKAYSDINHKIVGLTQTVKAWARRSSVHGASIGHLSSYSFSLMAIFYMQVRGALPCLQSAAVDFPKYYSEGGKTWNVAMDLSSPRGPHPDVEVSFKDFVKFYLTEYTWGDGSVVSVRIGSCRGVDSFPSLKTKLRDGISAEEAEQMLHIEDPFDTSRNTNCVLAKGNTIKLWCALEDAAADSEKPPPPAEEHVPISSRPRAPAYGAPSRSADPDGLDAGLAADATDSGKREVFPVGLATPPPPIENNSQPPERRWGPRGGMRLPHADGSEGWLADDWEGWDRNGRIAAATESGNREGRLATGRGGPDTAWQQRPGASWSGSPNQEWQQRTAPRSWNQSSTTEQHNRANRAAQQSTGWQ